MRHTKEEETDTQRFARSLSLTETPLSPSRPPSPLSSPARSRTQQEQQNTERCHLPSAASSASSPSHPRSPRNEDTQLLLFFPCSFFFLFNTITPTLDGALASRVSQGAGVCAETSLARRRGVGARGGGRGAHLLWWFAAREARRRESCALSRVHGEQNVWR